MNILIARISDLSQFDENNNIINYYDDRINIWDSSYNNLSSEDKAIFLNESNAYLGDIKEKIQGKEIIVQNIEKLNITSSEILYYNEIQPEIISRVKANFLPFIHPFQIDLNLLIKEINNKTKIKYIVSNDINKLNSIKLYENDRIIYIKNNKVSNIFKVSKDKKLFESNELNKLLNSKEYSLNELVKIQLSNNKKRTVSHLTKISNALLTKGYYIFNSFSEYHDCFFNSTAYRYTSKFPLNNYWIFQGNPKVYDFENALKNNEIKTWSVNQNKDKIKKNDKVIIWLAGKKSGCYGLANVESDPEILDENDPNWLKEIEKGKERVKLKITNNFYNNPILKNELNNIEEFNDFKGGNQGTNFAASEEQYKIMMNIWFDKILNISFNKIDISEYFNFLSSIILKFNFEINDQRLYFNYLINDEKITRLIFVVGQRYSWILDSKAGFGAISREIFGDKNDPFNITNDKSKIPVYLNWTKNYDDISNKKEIIYTAIENELKSAKKSSYRSENKIDFEEYVFNNLNQKPMETPKFDYPLNQILYGPPGTGKTYNTIKLAAEIIKCKKFDSPKANVEAEQQYNEAVKIYKENLGDRIKFVTFHQNFSYEDFVQGLKPDTNDSNNMTFDYKPGVFKTLADKAKTNLIESLKEPEELSERDAFIIALENMKERITENDENIQISKSAYLYSVEEDAFRYTGKNWTLNEKGFNGFRMRYNDLLEIFDNKINERKQIKELKNISGLAKQHATYFFNTYEMLKNEMNPVKKDSNFVKKQSYVLIIDEINRANISRVFGELITLIEEDKRWDGIIDDSKVKWEVTLPSGDPFVVPDNLYIIGTMNTADKSIALLDVALRRRFTFKGYYPKYHPEIEYKNELYSNYLQILNGLIVDKLGAGRGHDLQIGHSYFMNINSEEDFINSMNDKVIPLLMEYTMNNLDDVKEIISNSFENKNNKMPYKLEDSYPLKIKTKVSE